MLKARRNDHDQARAMPDEWPVGGQDARQMEV
jgi:hypothetical protein